MKPPPDWLPEANSRKWHSRRWWDSLGYLRARTLANAGWKRDVPWLLRVIEDDRPGTPGPARDAIDDALRALRRYRDLPQSVPEKARDQQWDRMLNALDCYLTIRQQEHLAAVDEAGASGRT